MLKSWFVVASGNNEVTGKKTAKYSPSEGNEAKLQSLEAKGRI